MSNLAIPEKATEVERLSHVRRELAGASALPDINRVIQQASAIQEQALRAKQALRALGWAEEVIRQSIDIANEAGAISLDAQAKAGGILRQMAEHGDRNTDLGVSKSDAFRFQQVERVPAEVRQEYVEQTKAEGGNVTRGGLLEHAQRAGAKSEVHQHAEDVLRGLLADGPIGSRELHAALKAADVSEWAFALAKRSLNLAAEKIGSTVVWKYADQEVEIPRLGQGWECPTCGGYGWVELKPKRRNERGYTRERRAASRRAHRTNSNTGD